MTMPIPDGSVVITPAQMYGQIGELTNAVRDLKGAVDPALSELRKTVTDHEATIRVLVRDNTITKTQLRAAWAALGVLLVALGVVAAFMAVGH